MAAQHLFVISDLHLGGDDGFQLCSKDGQAHLSRFIDEVRERHGADGHLIINGDFIDLLAEAPFAPFTPDQGAALRKLEQAMAHAAPVFAALRDLLQGGAALTLLLGNHDLELCLPRVRRALLDRLGPGRVEFLYDNQALTVGGALIEHGNRDDDWNAVRHDELRQLRSVLSRGEPATAFAAPPGSELVARVMNPLKRRYAFVDMLKPEDAAVPPLLAFLEPGLVGDLRQLYEMARLNGRRKLVDLQTPQYRGAAATGDPHALDDPPRPAEPMGLTRGYEGPGGAERSAVSSAWSFLQLWRMSRDDQQDRARVLLQLRRALRSYTKARADTFHLNREDPLYADPARQALQRGFDVVIYGHTHLVKRVEMDAGLYLNTGTWGDLMRLPAAVTEQEETPAALEELAAFADDLAQNRLDRWRRQLATYAHLVVTEGGAVVSADVLRFDEQGNGADLIDGEVLVAGRSQGE